MLNNSSLELVGRAYGGGDELCIPVGRVVSASSQRSSYLLFLSLVVVDGFGGVASKSGDDVGVENGWRRGQSNVER